MVHCAAVFVSQMFGIYWDNASHPVKAGKEGAGEVQMIKKWKKLGILAVICGTITLSAWTVSYGAGPGDGLDIADGLSSYNAQTEESGTDLPGSKEMTAVSLDVSIAEITGNQGVAILDAPGGQGSYGFAYPKTVYRVLSDAGNGWIEIAYDGHSAYLDGNSGQITVTNTWNIPKEEEDKAELIKLAMNLLGAHYQMGASDPAVGFDCSGFIRYLMKAYAGLELPRTSEEQARLGTDRPADDLKVGDLIAFGSSLDAVSHAGIYIGNGRMIHGDGTGKGVTICVWNDRTDIPRIANLLGV